MYLPSHFEEKRPEVLQELMQAHPLGLLVTQGESGLQANPIPFVFDADPAGGRRFGDTRRTVRTPRHLTRARPCTSHPISKRSAPKFCRN